MTWAEASNAHAYHDRRHRQAQGPAPLLGDQGTHSSRARRLDCRLELAATLMHRSEVWRAMEESAAARTDLVRAAALFDACGTPYLAGEVRALFDALEHEKGF